MLRNQQKNKYIQSKRKDPTFRSSEQKYQTLKKQHKKDNEIYRTMERERETKNRSLKRKQQEYRQIEIPRDSKAKQERRKDTSFRQTEREREAFARHVKQTNSCVKLAETLRETKTRQDQRKDSSYRQTERERDAKARHLKRTDHCFKPAETLRETKTRQERRKDSSFRQSERERDAKARHLKRTDHCFKLAETLRETKTRQERRKDSSFRQSERERDAKARHLKRTDHCFKLTETLRETKTRQERRKDSSFRQIEKEKDAISRHAKRTNPHIKETEIQRETISRKEKRKAPMYKHKETVRETEVRRVKRTNIAEYRQNELTGKHMRKQQNKPDSLGQLVINFHSAVEQGPTYVCTSCEQLFYKQSVQTVTKALRELAVANKCLQAILSEGQKEWLCNTCKNYMKKKLIPPCSIANNMAFPYLPPIHKELHTLELRLVAIRIPFMKIYQAPRGKQLKIAGNVVNVPSNMVQTVTSLPRLPDQDGTIKVNLKRKLSHVCSVQSQNIRPNKVRNAAQYLVENSNLYKKENVVFDSTWTYSTTASENDIGDQTVRQDVEVDKPYLPSSSVSNATNIDQTDLTSTSTHSGKDSKSQHNVYSENRNVIPELEVPFLNNTEDVMDSETSFHNVKDASVYNDEPREKNIHTEEIHEHIYCKTHIQHDPTSKKDNHNNEISENDGWNEIDDTEIHGGMTDTLFTSPDFIEEEEKDNIWSFAPGQGNLPTSIFKDTNCEELAFPGIFAGNARPTNNDRSVRVLYSDIVKSEIQRRDRRVARSVDNLFFKVKKLQMQQIYGKSQIALRKVSGKNENLTAGALKKDGAINNLLQLDEGYRVLRTVRGSPPYFEQAKKDLFALIRQLGPATLFLSFSAAETQWTHLLKILSKIVDSIDLTDSDVDNLSWEEKTRLIQSDPVTCSRHFHYSVQELLKFFQSGLMPLRAKMVDYFYCVEYQHRGSPHIHMLVWLQDVPKYQEDADEDVIAFIDSLVSCSIDHAFAKYQMHRHSRTCQKLRKRECRFNFPKPPMKNTVILKPLDEIEEKEIHSNNFKKIKRSLEDMALGNSLSLDELLEQLQLTEDQYMMAIRSSISSPTIFLKRLSNEIRINAYIPTCLSAWRANMDSQYILDIYQCAMYVVAYVSKSQRGMSLLLDAASKEAKEKGSNIKEKVRLIENKFTNNVEMSAQEAVDICLQVPLRKCSRQVIFVPTSESTNRTFLLKSFEEIHSMEDDDDQVTSGNLLTRYTDRPHALENVTLADWAAWYDKPGKIGDSLQNNENESDSDNLVVDITCTRHNIKKRRTARILRSVRYNQEHDPENYCREKIMLYTHWRDEQKLKGNSQTYQGRYKKIEATIQEQLQAYEPNAAAVDSAEALVQDEIANEELDNLAPNTEHANQVDKTIDHLIHDPTLFPPDNMPESDLGSDLGIPSLAKDTQIPFHEMNSEQYRSLLLSLNIKQREFLFFNDILIKVKTSDAPIYAFLSGGAGVGKSRVLTAIYQASMKYFNSLPGSDYNTRHVLVVAPTGKAAYNVSGNTVQSAFRVPVSQGIVLDTPSSDKLNTLRTQLGQLKLVIIDEVSMVGFRMFNLIHKRLQDIKGCSKDFGGVSVICFGDLFQLKPVYDAYLF